MTKRIPVNSLTIEAKWNTSTRLFVNIVVNLIAGKIISVKNKIIGNKKYFLRLIILMQVNSAWQRTSNPKTIDIPAQAKWSVRAEMIPITWNLVTLRESVLLFYENLADPSQVDLFASPPPQSPSFLSGLISPYPLIQVLLGGTAGING